jgi:secondary thiamine-phosphate synthase enzyme
MQELTVTTSAPREMVDISEAVQRAVDQSGLVDGICYLFVPHTTCALTLNENWDPHVPQDIQWTLDTRTAPAQPEHRHSEGNSPAHLKSSLFGASLFVFIEAGKLQLGRWQGIFLAEFDGPRRRRLWIRCTSG